MDSLGEFVRLRRKRLRYQSKTVAAKIGVTPTTISQIEAGKQQPTIDTIRKLAEVLESPVEEFLARAPWVPIGDAFDLEKLADSGLLRGMKKKIDEAELTPAKRHLVDLVEGLPEQSVEPVAVFMEALIERARH